MICLFSSLNIVKFNITESSWLKLFKIFTFCVYLSVTTLADWTAPTWEKNYLIESEVELNERPPMNNVGVSMLALVSIGLCYLCWPFPKFFPLPGIDCPLGVGFPLASSIFKFLPKCSTPLSSKAAFNSDLFPNLTNAIPLDFPSGLESKLTLRMVPHGSNKALISES